MDSNNSFFVSSGFCIPNFYILLTWYIDPLIKWLNHNFLMDLGLLVSAMGFSSISHSICSLCLLILLSCVCFSDGWLVRPGQRGWPLATLRLQNPQFTREDLNLGCFGKPLRQRDWSLGAIWTSVSIIFNGQLKFSKLLGSWFYFSKYLNVKINIKYN